MGWFNRGAETRLLLALAKLEATMALDLSKLQTDVAAQGTIIQSVQARVAALETGSSAEQAAVDAIASTVESNNAALTALATAPST